MSEYFVCLSFIFDNECSKGYARQSSQDIDNFIEALQDEDNQ